MRGGTCLVGALWILACGGAEGPTVVMPELQEVDPYAFLRAYGAENTITLAPVIQSIEEIEETVRNTRGQERIQALRTLALALMLDADDAERRGEERDARRLRRRALQLARRVVRATRDELVAAEMDFLNLWIAWRQGRPAASRLAERFTERRRRSGELLLLAWIIRGEVAFEAERWERAKQAYRYLLGMIDHPLYAYALLRTAHASNAQGDGEEAERAMREVVHLGCRNALPKYARMVTEAAASQTGTALVEEPDGARRPAHCRDGVGQVSPVSGPVE